MLDIKPLTNVSNNNISNLSLKQNTQVDAAIQDSFDMEKTNKSEILKSIMFGNIKEELNNNDEHGLPRKKLHQKLITFTEEQKNYKWVFSKIDVKITSNEVKTFEFCQSIPNEFVNNISVL